MERKIPLVQAKPALNTTYHPQNPVPRASNHNYSPGSFSNVEISLTPHQRLKFIHLSRWIASANQHVLTAHDRRLVVIGHRGTNHVAPPCHVGHPSPPPPKSSGVSSPHVLSQLCLPTIAQCFAHFLL